MISESATSPRPSTTNSLASTDTSARERATLASAATSSPRVASPCNSPSISLRRDTAARCDVNASASACSVATTRLSASCSSRADASPRASRNSMISCAVWLRSARCSSMSRSICESRAATRSSWSRRSSTQRESCKASSSAWVSDTRNACSRTITRTFSQRAVLEASTTSLRSVSARSSSSPTRAISASMPWSEVGFSKALTSGGESNFACGSGAATSSFAASSSSSSSSTSVNGRFGASLPWTTRKLPMLLSNSGQPAASTCVI